jgi:hypothetical protein
MNLIANIVTFLVSITLLEAFDYIVKRGKDVSTVEPRRKLEENSLLFENQSHTFITHGPIRVVISLTTSPLRLPEIRGVLRNIFKQTVLPDVVQLNIPRRFNRTNELYETALRNAMGKFFHEFDKERFRVVRCQDHGPITKYIPTLEIEQNASTLIIAIDDDTAYPKNMIETMLKIYQNNSNVVLAGHCGNILLNPPNERESRIIAKHPSNILGHACCCRFFEGFGAVGFRRGLIDNRHFFEEENKLLDFWQYIELTSQNASCLRADDIVISNYFSLVGTLGINLTPYVKIWQLGYGFEEDALHRIDEKLSSVNKGRQTDDHILNVSLFYKNMV